MRRRIAVVVAIALVSMFCASLSAQNPVPAQIQAALNALGLRGIGYSNGQCAGWSTSQNKYIPTTCAGGGGGGVSSVAMTVPSALLTVTGSPITSSGTFAVTLGTRAANLVFAGPTTGSAATPTFRSLVAADLPWTLNGNTTVLATVSGTYTTHDLLYADGAGNTADSGILYSAFPLANLATQAAHTVVANNTGSAAAPTAVTLSALIDASIDSTQGDILYRGSSTWTDLGPGTSGYYLKTQGAAANPIWAAVTATPGGSSLDVQCNVSSALSACETGVFTHTASTHTTATNILTALGKIVAFSSTAIPSGGTTGDCIAFSSTSNFGICFGSGSPTLSAAEGSIYLQSDGGGAIWANTNGSTGWAAAFLCSGATSSAQFVAVSTSGCTLLANPLPVADGGTGATSLTNLIALGDLATQANNTVVGNTSGSGAAPSALTALPLPTDYALPVAVCQNTTASAAGSLPTSSPAVAACNTGTHVQQGVLQYAASSDLFWQTHFPMPVDVTTSSTIDYYLTWYSATTSGNVVWTIGYACIAAGAVADASFTTTTTPAAAAAGTTLQYVHSSKTGVTGCAAGNELQLQIERNAGSGSDTMSGTANLVSLTIVVRRTVAIGG